MDFSKRLQSINTWRRGDERAPHKPLLLLLMIGRYANGADRMIPFAEVEGTLQDLLVEFGPHRKTYHPEHPFWHLHSDGFWDLSGIDPAQMGNRHTSATRKALRGGVCGGVADEVFAQLKDHAAVRSTVSILLNEHFPESMHADILRAVGLDPSHIVRRAPRDPRFREKILRAYRYECAVCGFSARLGRALVGIEAAHIKWHTVGGPDSEPNGVALCALHHKLFDRGIFTIRDDMTILVSESATGSAMFGHLVTDFHGQALRDPQRTTYRPEPSFLAWHVREVFHPPAREVRPA